jgi:hypothetical protein
VDSFEFQIFGIKAKAKGKIASLGACVALLAALGIAIWSAASLGTVGVGSLSRSNVPHMLEPVSYERR